jgi:hypothetical protein
MPSAVFEIAIVAIKRQQAYAVDRTATGISIELIYYYYNFSFLTNGMQ